MNDGACDELECFQTNPLEYILGKMSEAGDVVRLSIAEKPHFFLRTPAAIDHVLRHHADRYEKRSRFRAALGEGLVTSENNIWRHQRKVIAPTFGELELVRMKTQIADQIELFSRGWQEKVNTRTPIDLAAEMPRLALDIALAAMFGAGDELKLIDAVRPAIETVSMLIQSRWPDIPSWHEGTDPACEQFRMSMEKIDAIVDAIIDYRKNHPSDSEDLLSRLLAAMPSMTGHQEGGASRQLRDEIKTMLIAGHETTGNTLSWALAELSFRPDWHRHVASEASAPVETKGTSRSQAAKSKTLAVINETLRLYPPVWIISRMAIQEDVICGVRVPREATCLICPYARQHDDRIWAEPFTFSPERFLVAVTPVDDYDFFPFGLGSRRCLGEKFAVIEATMALRALCSRFEIELQSSQRPPIRLASTLGAQSPVTAILRRAQSSAMLP